VNGDPRGELTVASEIVSRLWWTLTLTVITAFVGGSVVSVADPATELRYVLGIGLVAAPVVFVLLGRRRERWLDPHPFARFLTFLFSLFVAVVTLDLLANLVLGIDGPVARAGELLAIATGFAVALWATFGDAAERAWAYFLEVSGTDW
jgi:FtsH-binding integral membrane protein